MHSNLKDILDNGGQPVTDRQLIDYLNGSLPDAAQHQVEKAMSAGAMEDDALEGLQLVSNLHKLAQYQADINHSLHEKLKQKKQGRRHKKAPQVQGWLLMTAAIVALALFVWFIIRLMYSNGLNG